MDYDGFAPAYAQHRRADPAVVRALVVGARIRASARVLEVGSGTGNYAIAVHEATAATCTGVEPSAEMRANAVPRRGAVDFVEGRADRLPVADESFDLVYSVDVVHHLADVDAAFAEAARVLRAGGLLCTVTDDELSIRGRVHRRYFPETLAFELTRYPTLDRLAEAARAAGLEPGPVERVETPVTVTSAAPFRQLAFSSLALIPREALEAGLERMERDLAQGQIEAMDRHVLVWARKP